MPAWHRAGSLVCLPASSLPSTATPTKPNPASMANLPLALGSPPSSQGMKELRSLCRARVTLATAYEPGTELRRLTIAGTLDEIQEAISHIRSRLP